MSFDLDLTARRALVTAGTKGVGAAVVETLRDAGAQVITTARSIPLGAPKACATSPQIFRPKGPARLPIRYGSNSAASTSD